MKKFFLFLNIYAIAYFVVHSLAFLLYKFRSDLYILAISGTNGSSGLASHNSEQIDNKTLKINERTI